MDTPEGPFCHGSDDNGAPSNFIFGFRGIGGTSIDCGDGVKDPGEECDDGNTDNGDGCDDHRAVERFVPPEIECLNPTVPTDAGQCNATVDCGDIATCDSPTTPLTGRTAIP